MIKFWIPKVYSWEDVKKQILKDMASEGMPLDGISAGSTTTELNGTMFSIIQPGIVGTNVDKPVMFTETPREAGYAVR